MCWHISCISRLGRDNSLPISPCGREKETQETKQVSKPLHYIAIIICTSIDVTLVVAWFHVARDTCCRVVPRGTIDYKPTNHLLHDVINTPSWYITLPPHPPVTCHHHHTLLPPTTTGKLTYPNTSVNGDRKPQFDSDSILNLATKTSHQSPTDIEINNRLTSILVQYMCVCVN